MREDVVRLMREAYYNGSVSVINGVEKDRGKERMDINDKKNQTVVSWLE